ncbi:MAG: ABC-F family ATP-binding cassette domain-containing protein [candidate division WOR-3 bacterium]|nr:MAG: ABC-F family ATP-binding cassette domain-containing protein [candidate division WOR-3 bacterium]
MLSLINIEYSIGVRTLFSQVTLNVNPFDRFGLVGANGTGKTTLLKIINGETLPTKGSVRKLKNITMGYLPQEEIVLRGNTLRDEILKDYYIYLKNLSRIGKLVSEQPHSRVHLKKYETAEDHFHKIGGYNYEAEAYRVIHGLGFTHDDFKRPVQEFSSGWQMRIVLARILLNKPDLLLLDEPTNHLDIDSIQWLENYLQSFNGAMIVVSHDRYFLDRILQTPRGTRGIWEIDLGMFRRYRTNYTGYLEESRFRKERLIHLAKTQEKRIAEIKEFVARNKANKSKARIVKSREKYLERIDRVQVESERKKIKVAFPVEPVHSRRLVELKNVSKIYDGKPVFKGINLSIERGNKIALIGKNGAGKSTLCRIIAGHEKTTTGERKVSEKLKIATFSHELLLQLNPARTVLEEATQDVSLDVNQGIRKFLGLFLFSGDDVFKKIEVLSGGEKTRLVILKAMLKPSNLLILDEPTYHLDRDSTEVIKQAVMAYSGTVILVTHNRDLIASFATRVIELKDNYLHDYPGDFSYYLWKKGGADTLLKGKRKKIRESPQDRMRKQVMQKQERRNKLRESFSRPTVVNNPSKAKKLFQEYQKLTEEIEQLERTLSDDEP